MFHFSEKIIDFVKAYEDIIFNMTVPTYSLSGIFLSSVSFCLSSTYLSLYSSPLKNNFKCYFIWKYSFLSKIVIRTKEKEIERNGRHKEESHHLNIMTVLS